MCDSVDVTVVDVAALADALIQRLNPTLPEGCWLERGTNSSWGGVWLFTHTREGSWGGSGIANLAETVGAHDLPWVVELALDAVQDDVAHATQGTAWPSDPSDPRPLPSPWAKVRDEALAFGYGSVCLADDIRVSDLAL